MAIDDVELMVVERQSPVTAASVDYIPFGVKTLKVRVRRNPVRKPALGPIWVHPKNYGRPDGGSSDPGRWRVYGTADDDPDLWVAWGAGDERGFCVKTKDRFKINKVARPLDDDGSYYVYLHLIDRTPLTPNPSPQGGEGGKRLTVWATDEQGEVRGELEVELTRPAGTVNPLRAEWEWDGAAGVSTIRLRAIPLTPNPSPQGGEGGLRQAGGLSHEFPSAQGGEGSVPLYVSRWWPTLPVTYKPLDQATAAFVEQLQVRYLRQANGQDRGQVEVWHGGDLLAQLGGDLALPLHDYRLCSVELFRFVDDYHLVLRLWFYWVHLGFSVEELLRFVPAGDRVAWRPEAERVQKGLRQRQLLEIAGQALNAPLLFPWHKREEVPDVERFDLLLDPRNLAVQYVGTDTHWQEFWAIVNQGEPLQARIATLLDTKKVKDQADAVPEVKKPVCDPLANGLCDIVNEASQHDCPHRPGEGQLVTAKFIKKGAVYQVCGRCQSHFIGQGVKALGIAKHAPLLGNVDVIINAVSTSVLEG